MTSQRLSDSVATARRGESKPAMSRILFNSDLVDSVTDELFDKNRQVALATGDHGGRGTVTQFDHIGQSLVLKSYFRGGLPGRFIRSTYFFTGLERTRMWREFHLLREMDKMGLPVPRPFAARCLMTSPVTYRGDLIMRQIQDSRSLSELLSEETLDDASWARIGEVIAQFHGKMVFHRDLNASNILLTSSGEVFLVDFDKCCFKSRRRANGNGWALANLKRLQQSLYKISGRAGSSSFNQDHWQALRRGYDSAERN